MGSLHKLSESDKEKIRELRASGMMNAAIAKKFGVSNSTVSWHSRTIKVPKKKKAQKAKPISFMDVPMATEAPVQSSSPKVMVIVTDAANIKTVVGELWK